MTTKKCT